MLKHLHQSRGQGIVEFAVIFPIMAIFLFAIVDGGLVMGRYNNANQAAGVGARLAATGTSLSTVRSRVQDQMHNGMSGTTCNGTGDDICIDYRNGPNGEPAGSVGSIVVVFVVYEYDLLSPIGTLTGGGDWDIEACSFQRVERTVPNAASIDDDTGECD